MASLHLRSSTIRLILFISTLIIAVIFIIQLAWLRKVYRLEEKEFDHSVVKAIRGVYEDLNVQAYYSLHLNELLEKPESHLYLAQISLPVNADTLVNYLQYELEDFDVFTDCQLGVYNSNEKKFIFSTVLTFAPPVSKYASVLPLFKRDYDYLALYFPNRKQYILSQMNFWIISSAILLMVLILFTGGLYYFYRQKFILDIQKDFIHNFAHEFKTPVSVIGLAADAIKNRGFENKPDKLATYAGIVEYQANYLQSQIEKLLKFAYTESKQLQLDKKPVNIHELINESISNLAPLISERKVKLTLDFKAENPVIHADRDYILIVITNLLDNAIKYSKNPVILVTTREHNQHFVISVKDNGIGIVQAEMKKIFKRFYRIKKGEIYTTKGFGLGLNFVKKILDAHHGKVSVDSETDKGSVFKVELPIN